MPDHPPPTRERIEEIRAYRAHSAKVYYPHEQTIDDLLLALDAAAAERDRREALHTKTLGFIADQRDAALSDCRTLAAEVRAWRDAWRGQETPSFQPHEPMRDPYHAHDTPYEWDDRTGPCDSCLRFKRVEECGAATDAARCLARHAPRAEDHTP